MQQTSKYKFGIIESGDLFGPDVLNRNTRAVETELARVEGTELGKVNAELARVNTELARVEGTELGKVNAELARVNTELSRMEGTELGKVNGELAQVNAELARLNAELVRLNTELAQVNIAHNSLAASVLKFACGTFVGDRVQGHFIPLPFTPRLVYVGDSVGAVNISGIYYGGVAMEGVPVNIMGGDVVAITPGGFMVSHYSNSESVNSGGTYRYFAIG